MIQVFEDDHLDSSPLIQAYPLLRVTKAHGQSLPHEDCAAGAADNSVLGPGHAGGRQGPADEVDFQWGFTPFIPKT